VATAFGLTQVGAGGTTAARRIGWIELDLGVLFDETAVPRHIATGGVVSRFPSSDIDLALVVEDRHPADVVAETLRHAGGDLIESVALFDVYRGAGVPAGARSLANRIRFVSADHTLTDAEVGGLRATCIRAAEEAFAAVLR
jgi:phenylalanyl-tRNA synthetase beta chain